MSPKLGRAHSAQSSVALGTDYPLGGIIPISVFVEHD